MRLLCRVLAAMVAAVLLVTVPFLSGTAEAATKPSVPRSVTATPLNKAVKVTWKVPARVGSSRIDAYAVQRRNTTSSPWVTVKYTGPAARNWTETGLVNGARFYYRVMARNRSGWGPASPQVSAVPRTVPGAPRSPEADAYDAALGARWTAPASNGFAAIDRYEVQWSLDGDTWSAPRTAAVPGTPAAPVLLPLTPGSRYWLRVRAHNAAGFGPATGFGPYTVRRAPGPVTGLTATPGFGQAELSWTAPVVDSPVGSTAVASYRVEVSTDGANWVVAQPEVIATSTVVTGLAAGTTYHFRVTPRSVVEKIGDGQATTVIAAGPVTGPPSAPQDLSLDWDEDAGTYLLAWQAPASDGGADLDHYEVEWSTDGPTQSQTVGATTLQTALTGFVADGTARVRACNGTDAATCGDWSTAGPITGPVQDLHATETIDGTVRTVTVAWTAPPGDLAVSYDVLRSDDAGTTFTPVGTVLAPATELADLTAAASTDYVYKVVPHGGGTGQPRTTTITTSAD